MFSQLLQLCILLYRVISYTNTITSHPCILCIHMYMYSDKRILKLILWKPDVQLMLCWYIHTHCYNGTTSICNDSFMSYFVAASMLKYVPSIILAIMWQTQSVCCTLNLMYITHCLLHCMSCRYYIQIGRD